MTEFGRQDNSDQADFSQMEESLAFFGAITASVSHEVNNVLSIIDQTAGLLEDLMIGSKTEINITAEKLDRIVSSMQNQIQRGRQIVKNLNSFVHGTDQARRKFDVREALQNLIQMSDRLAGLKGVKLEAVLSDVPLIIDGNPFFFQQAVFESLRWAFMQSSKGMVISVRARKNEETIEVLVECPMADLENTAPRSSHLQSIFGAMPGGVEIDRQQDRIIFRFVFPGCG